MKNNYVPNRLGKKITAGITAAAILVGGTLIAKLTIKNKRDLTEDTSSTSISTTVNYKSQYGLVLTEDFNINNTDEVRKRAKDIYELSEKEYTVEDIINMIYLINNSVDKIKLTGMDEEEKFRYLQKLATGLYDVISDNLIDDANALTSLNSNQKSNVKNDTEIFSYMFIANGKGKEEAINLAIIVNKQLNDIKNGNTSSFKENADKFYGFSKTIYSNKSKYPDGVLIVLIDDIKSKIPVMGLSKQQGADLSKEEQNVDINKVWFDAADKLGAYIEADADCETKVKHTTNHEKYEANDASKAQAIVNSNTKSNTTKKVDNGGTPVRTEKVTQKSSKPITTREETSEFVVPVVTTKPTTTIVDQGGKVVEEHYVDSDAEEAEKLAGDVTYTIPKK